MNSFVKHKMFSSGRSSTLPLIIGASPALINPYIATSLFLLLFFTGDTEINKQEWEKPTVIPYTPETTAEYALPLKGYLEFKVS